MKLLYLSSQNTQHKLFHSNESEKKEKEGSSVKLLESTVHVVLSVDKNQLKGLLLLVQSLKDHLSKQITIHIVCSTQDFRLLQTWIKCVFPHDQTVQLPHSIMIAHAIKI